MIHRAPIFTFVFCFFFLLYNHAQIGTSKIDSLKNQLSAQKNDSAKVELINELLELTEDELEYKNYNSLMRSICERNLGKYKNSNLDFFRLYHASGLINDGYYHSQKSEYNKALSCYLKAGASLDLIKKETDDVLSAQAYLYNNISSVYKDLGKNKEAFKFQWNAVKIFETLNDEDGLAMAYGNLGGFYDDRGKSDTAIFYHLKSLKIYTKLGNIDAMATLNNNLASLYDKSGNRKEAIAYYLKALDLIKNTGNERSIAFILQNIGISYGESGNIKIGIEYLSKALQLFKQLNDKKGEYYALSNIAGIYYRDNDYKNAEFYFLGSLEAVKSIQYYRGYIASYYRLGNIYAKKDSLDKAKEYYYKAIQLSVADIPDIMLVNSYTSLADLYKTKASNDSAVYYYNKSISLAESLGFKLGKVSASVSLADLLFQTGQHQEAKKLAEKSLELSKNLGYIVELKNVSTLLYHIYKKENNTVKALEMHELSVKMNDSLKTEESQKAIIRSQLTDEYEQKRLNDSLLFENQRAQQSLVLEKNSLDLSAEKKRNWMLIVLTAIFILIAVVYYGLYKIKANKNRLLIKKDQERELLMHEIHHRIKNNLQIVSGLLKMPQKHVQDDNAKEVLDESRQRIHSISLIHKLLYENNNVKEVNTALYFKELCETVVQGFSEPNQKIDLEMMIAEVYIPIDDFVPLALILNELLLNSIKHAFSDVQQAKISIYFKNDKKQYNLIYADNGENDFSSKIKDKSSFGTRMMYNLAQQLNGIINVTFNNGTEIKLNFPVIKA